MFMFKGTFLLGFNRLSSPSRKLKNPGEELKKTHETDQRPSVHHVGLRGKSRCGHL